MECTNSPTSSVVLGIGTPTDPPTNQLWIELLEKLNTVSTHAERVETVMSTFSSLPPAAARKSHPEIDRVIGGSWLYTTSSYASLFPEQHMTKAVVRRGRRTFRGMSHWGQFLDHRWNLRGGLAEQFRRRVENWTGDDPSLLFPLDTLEVSSPVAVFDSPHPQSIAQ
jgi:hypothetical protein